MNTSTESDGLSSPPPPSSTASSPSSTSPSSLTSTEVPLPVIPWHSPVDPWVPTIVLSGLMVLFLGTSFVLYHLRNLRRRRAALVYALDRNDFIGVKPHKRLPQFKLHTQSLSFHSGRDPSAKLGARFSSINPFEHRANYNPLHFHAYRQFSCPAGGYIMSETRPTQSSQFGGCSIDTDHSDLRGRLAKQRRDFFAPDSATLARQMSLTENDDCREKTPRISLSRECEFARERPINTVRRATSFGDHTTAGPRGKSFDKAYHQHPSLNSYQYSEPATVAAGDSSGLARDVSIENLGIVHTGDCPSGDHSPLCIICLVIQAKSRPVGICSSCFSSEDPSVACALDLVDAHKTVVPFGCFPHVFHPIASSASFTGGGNSGDLQGDITRGGQPLSNQTIENIEPKASSLEPSGLGTLFRKAGEKSVPFPLKYSNVSFAPPSAKGHMHSTNPLGNHSFDNAQDFHLHGHPPQHEDSSHPLSISSENFRIKDTRSQRTRNDFPVSPVITVRSRPVCSTSTVFSSNTLMPSNSPISPASSSVQRSSDVIPMTQARSFGERESVSSASKVSTSLKRMPYGEIDRENRTRYPLTTSEKDVRIDLVGTDEFVNLETDTTTL